MKFMLEAMKKAGWYAIIVPDQLGWRLKGKSQILYNYVGICVHCSEVCTERHLVCEPCGPTVAGGYDELKQQVQ